MIDNVNRKDSASRIIRASAQAIYTAFLDPQALVKWLPPEGMIGHIDEFNAREGEAFRMTLTYVDTNHSTGKTSEDTDVIQGRFLELVQDKRIVQRIEFESEDPSYAGAMIMTWNLITVPEGIKVTIDCENVPEGIGQDEHEEGLRSTLAGLAALLE
ncbi:SRPBCC domain-containing protein [Paenibacillus albidus]|uniref:SRPBCC domain-containing protein n=1 Tax=Paenibacillus albidus TaxID=2041023 RepID=UPI001BE77384|nr:SRPBCC domain-containing protein [Paenibacillus albidus]MBT2288726.1 SRPBCC domain-containing protein [Paenibacillus albidus]